MNKTNGTNNGGKNSAYLLPGWVKDVDDLNEYLRATGPLSNITKSLFSNIMDRHKGTTAMRDAKKMLHYSIRHLMWLRRPKEENVTSLDVVKDLFDEMSDEYKVEFANYILGIGIAKVTSSEHPVEFPATTKSLSEEASEHPVVLLSDNETSEAIAHCKA